jgi:hypothetical protein
MAARTVQKGEPERWRDLAREGFAGPPAGFRTRRAGWWTRADAVSAIFGVGARVGRGAERTVLQHLQKREGRDLDVLRGVHLRGVPGGALGLAPHHAPAAHHSRNVHPRGFVRVTAAACCAECAIWSARQRVFRETADVMTSSQLFFTRWRSRRAVFPLPTAACASSARVLPAAHPTEPSGEARAPLTRRNITMVGRAGLGVLEKDMGAVAREVRPSAETLRDFRHPRASFR